jgi:hypothetical protein
VVGLAALIGLVARRARARLGFVGLAAAAVVAAVTLFASLSGISVVAEDLALQRALSALPANVRSISVSGFAPSASKASQLERAAIDALSSTSSFGDELARGVLVRRVRDQPSAIELQLIALDDAPRWTTLVEGRYPTACRGSTCEAVLVSAVPAPMELPRAPRVAGLRLDVVGRATIGPLPFGELDQSGPSPGLARRYESSPPAALLLVEGTRGIAASSEIESLGRTYFWTQPVHASRIHPWTSQSFRSGVAEVERRLARASGRLDVASPVALIDAEERRGSLAADRLNLLGAVAIAVFLAFALFAGVIAHPDVDLEYRRLARFGGRALQRIAFVVLEAALPVLGGAVGGAIGAVATVAGFAAWANVEPSAVLAASLGTPSTIALLAGLAALFAVSLAFGFLPLSPEKLVRRAGPPVVLVGLALGWQLASTGPLDPETLSRTSIGPILILLPAIVALAVAGVFVALLPAVLRRLARRMRAAPIIVRLPLLSLARDPLRPAASLLLLAFSAGAAVFAVGYGSTLDAGVADQAAHRAGMDLRVVETGTELTSSPTVVPIGRYGLLGPEAIAYPIVRRELEAAAAGRVTVLGVPPEALPLLRGWRADYSAVPASELARRIAVPGSWTMAGRELTGDQVVVRLRLDGDPLRVAAVVATPDGDFQRVDFGTIGPGQHVLRSRLSGRAVGGTLVAVTLANSGVSLETGERQTATVTFADLDPIASSEAIRIEVSGSETTVVLRAPQPSDGVVLPAIVDPELAKSADDRRVVTLKLGTGGTIDLRVVATAKFFPTILAGSFAAVDVDPLLLALNTTAPGSALPNETWIRVPEARFESETREALSERPFRGVIVVSRHDLELLQADDPLARSAIWALTVTAFLALSLALLGIGLATLADVRDEGGELNELATQGVPPSGLRAYVRWRATWLVVGALGSGVLIGVMLVGLAAVALALSADARAPLPPLVVQVPWIAVGLLTTLTLGVILALVAVLARVAIPTLPRGQRG